MKNQKSKMSRKAGSRSAGKNKKFGFTLIEILVVTAIISLVTISSVQIFTFILRNNQKARAIMTVKQDGDSALRLMSQKIMGARRITSSCPPTPPTPTSDITIEDNLGQSLTISCISSAITMDGKILVDGTKDNLVIDSPSSCFTCYPGAGVGPDMVAISFTLKKAGGDPAAGTQLYFATSVSLRNY